MRRNGAMDRVQDGGELNAGLLVRSGERCSLVMLSNFPTKVLVCEREEPPQGGSSEASTLECLASIVMVDSPREEGGVSSSFGRVAIILALVRTLTVFE
jgi:hypothetical protein